MQTHLISVYIRGAEKPGVSDGKGLRVQWRKIFMKTERCICIAYGLSRACTYARVHDCGALCEL